MYEVIQSYFYSVDMSGNYMRPWMYMEKNTYTTLLYEVIYTTYMWGLRGRYFSTYIMYIFVRFLVYFEHIHMSIYIYIYIHFSYPYPLISFDKTSFMNHFICGFVPLFCFMCFSHHR